MRNELKTIIKRDPVDRDFYHIYANKLIGGRTLHWLVCSLHIDMLGEMTEDDTFQALAAFSSGEEQFVAIDISLIGDD